MRILSMTALALALVACGDSSQQGSASASGGSSVAAARSSSAVSEDGAQAPASRAASADSSPSRAAPAAAASGIGGRTGELLNPADSTVVLLYHDLADIAPPIDQWVEADMRVTSAPGSEKAARRNQVRGEIQAAAAAVRGIGFIRLSMNADLSDYDSTYGEFTVRALAPSAVVTFKAFNQQVSLRFGNGRDAQVWAVSQEQASAIRDELGYSRSVSLDALLRVTGVQPAPNGGTIITEVVEYEMRVARNGKLLGRVRPTAG
jgi:hypothetical protein